MKRFTAQDKGNSSRRKNTVSRRLKKTVLYGILHTINKDSISTYIFSRSLTLCTGIEEYRTRTKSNKFIKKVILRKKIIFYHAS